MRVTISNAFAAFVLVILAQGCVPVLPVSRTREVKLPQQYTESSDSTRASAIQWRDFFNDQPLVALIDTALNRNQELGILSTEVEMLRQEVRARKGEYLPSVSVGAGMAMEKEGRFTREGAVEEQLHIEEDKRFPEPLGNLEVGAMARWEVDIWKKLRNGRKAAAQRYLASAEGRNLAVTVLVAEVASTYYEIIALDRKMEVVKANTELQRNALNTIRQEKEAARVTELAVKRFEAQYNHTLNLQYTIEIERVTAENRLRMLVGDMYNPVYRSASFPQPDTIPLGVPGQLLENRPDIRQAELEMDAAGLDVDIARASFFPSLGISAGLGFRAYTPMLLLNPESAAYMLAGEIISPLINRNGIKSAYFVAGEKRTRALLSYQQRLIGAYLEVMGGYKTVKLFGESVDVKRREADILNEAVSISMNLYKSAYADYLEVLLTQREALDARMEVIETELLQMEANIQLYRALGGGWR